MFVRSHGLGQFYTGESVWDEIWPTQADSLAAGTAQIQSVPANAAAANAAAVAAGQPPPYNVPAIQAAADLQTQSFTAEIPQLWAVTSDPSTWPWYYWLAIGVGVFAVVKLAK